MEHGHQGHLHSGTFGDSLAPRQRERVSVEEEVARLSHGPGSRGRQLWMTLAAVAVAGIAAVIVVRVMGAQQLRTDAYAAVRTTDDDHAQKFLSCVLPGAQDAQLTTSATVLSMMERTGQRLGPRYAALLGQCAPELAALDLAVQQLQVPRDARDELEALRVSISELRRAVAAYESYLTGGTVDSVHALPHMDKAAVAWTTYTARRKALESALLPPIGRR
jgi:hypothetical protein